MGSSSLHQWESDPLFSAAEIVQDSADRMESLYRLLLHEKSLIQEDHRDPRLITSIEYHKRDLATILGTAKWQLEDFERAVASSASVDKSRAREAVISRHRQFIRAIREHINHVEKSIESPSLGDSTTNSEWVKLNEQERDGLALFLAGGNPNQYPTIHDSEDRSILKRFLDPTSASGLKDDKIIEHDVNRDMHVNGHIDYSNDKSIRMVNSHYSTRLVIDEINSLQEIPSNESGDDNHWDLEANEARRQIRLRENRLWGFNYITNLFSNLSHLWIASRNRVNRNYTKRLKDGEEQSQSPSFSGSSHSYQDQHIGRSLGFCSRLQASCQRFSYPVQVNGRSIHILVVVIFVLVCLGFLASKMA